MFTRNCILAIATVGSLAAAQGVLAAQPAGLGYDPYYVFGASRAVDAKPHIAQPTWNTFGYDPYYVLGTVGDIKESRQSSMSAAEQRANPFGDQAGA
jgi:hypothetical protein